MRLIQYLIIHCTAGSQQQTKKDVLQVFKEKGWANPGYHFLVMPDGNLECLLAIEGIANGVRGYNSNGIHVAWVGGKDGVDNRTPQQKEMLASVVKALRNTYPRIIVCGHRDLSPDLNGDGEISPNEWMKLCPCFDVKNEFKDLLR